MPAYGLATAARDGMVDYVPVSLGAMPALLAGALRPALAIVPAVRRGGKWAHLANVGLNDTITSVADRVVVQEVEDADDVGAPAVEGNVVARMDGGRMAAPRVVREPTAAEARIAQLAAELVPSGATVQYGIGAASEAALAAITRPVSILSGLVTDAVVGLHERGLLMAEAFGAYVWGGDSLRALVRAGRVVPVGVRTLLTGHQPSTIDHFVSINAALQVGLDGSVNVERVGARQIAGPGGHPDWCAAATRSRGGLSIVVVASTARDRSTIVAVPDVVSTPGTDVGIVVTEHGVADLRGRTRSERRGALIAIADPAHRDALARAAG
jgi:acyl-CoA hydrolase